MNLVEALTDNENIVHNINSPQHRLYSVQAVHNALELPGAFLIQGVFMENMTYVIVYNTSYNILALALEVDYNADRADRHP